MYTHNWFTLLYSRNQHNIVKQLYSNKKKIIKKLAEVIIAQKGFIMCSHLSHPNYEMGVWGIFS